MSVETILILMLVACAPGPQAEWQALCHPLEPSS